MDYYLEVALAGLEDAGGAEQHGDVRVVAARVHLPGVLALVLPLHRLLQPNNVNHHKPNVSYHTIRCNSCWSRTRTRTRERDRDKRR